MPVGVSPSVSGSRTGAQQMLISLRRCEPASRLDAAYHGWCSSGSLTSFDFLFALVYRSTGTGTIKKAIAPVPTAAQFLDVRRHRCLTCPALADVGHIQVVLSSTQRKTPTVIRSGFKITR